MKTIARILQASVFIFLMCHTAITMAEAQETEAGKLAGATERAQQNVVSAEAEATAKSTSAKTLEDKLASLKSSLASLQNKVTTTTEEEKTAREKAQTTAATLQREQDAEKRLGEQVGQPAPGTPDPQKVAEAMRKVEAARLEAQKAAGILVEKETLARQAKEDAARENNKVDDAEKQAEQARSEARKAEVHLVAVKADLETAKAAEKAWVSLNDSVYAKSLAALTMLFVVAVLLENALAVIFNWRVFLTYFSLTGVKTIVMISVALVVVWAFNIDILANLIAAYKSSPDIPLTIASGPMSKFVTALILAGGSAGIHNIMTALGFRNSNRQQEVIQHPPKTEAWISIRVKRVNAVGEVEVKIANLGAVGAAGAPPAPEPTAGTVVSRRPPLRDLFLRNINRFPQNGGYSLVPSTIYKISVMAKDDQGNSITRLGQTYVFAPGAIVDFDVTT